MTTLLEQAGFVKTASSKDIDTLHFRLPQELTPTPNNPLNIQNLDDMIIAGMLIQLMRMGNKNVNVTTLARFSNRGNARVKATLERLQDRGMLEMRKVRNEYEKQQFGYRWRIWIPQHSILNKLLHAKKGDGFKWVAVPLSVGRFRSPLATAMYMVLHLQKFVDGIITTTIADLSFTLNCDRKTARRLLNIVGARMIYRKGYQNAVYDLPTVYSRNITDKQEAAYIARLKDISTTLEQNGIFPERHLFSKTENIAALIAILELHYSNVLVKYEKHRANILLRIGRGYYNKRIKNRRLNKITKREADTNSLNVQLVQKDITSALNRVCSECNGDQYIEQVDPADGYVKLQSCKSCHPMHFK